MKVYISILTKGYYSSGQIWAGLALKDITATANIDNGFKTCEVHENDLQDTIAFIRQDVGENLRELEVHTTEEKARQYRSEYWK